MEYGLVSNPDAPDEAEPIGNCYFCGEKIYEWDSWFACGGRIRCDDSGCLDREFSDLTSAEKAEFLGYGVAV